MSDPRKLRSVEHYGQRYIQEYLAEATERRQTIQADPLAALEFMHGKMFMRGRRDSISVVFRDRTLEVMRTYTRLQDIDVGGLDDRLRERGVNNRYDRQMVIESVSFAQRNLVAHDCNIYNWAAAAIRANAA